MHALPTEPRAWFLGSAPSTFTTRWRERLDPPRRRPAARVARRGRRRPARRLGARGHRQRRRSSSRCPRARSADRPGRIGPFRIGWAVIALRTDAPIVPLAMAGTEELYLGRRMALAGPAGHHGAGPGRPAPATRRSRSRAPARSSTLAHTMSDALAAILGPVVEALHPRTVDPPGPSAAAPHAADLAAAATGPARPRRLTGRIGRSGWSGRRRPGRRAPTACCSRWSTPSGAGCSGSAPRSSGRQHLPRTADGAPAGGWIAAGLPHRTWVDPFVVTLDLPVEPRLTFFGDGRAIFRSRLAALGLPPRRRGHPDLAGWWPPGDRGAPGRCGRLA